jgi:DegV family protein with EDD domain
MSAQMSAVAATTDHVLDGTRLALLLRAGIQRLLSREEVINKINVFPVPDGDTGTNLALTLHAVLQSLRTRPGDHAGQLLTRVADAALDGARGNSGAILAQFLLGIGDRTGHLQRITAEDFAQAVAGGASYARDALAEPREGTILTVVADFAQEVGELTGRQGVRDFRQLFSRGLERARLSLEATRDQLESLRRANVVDAGAMGFVELLAGIVHYLETGELGEDDAVAVIRNDESTAGEEQDLGHRFCTECVVSGEDVDRRHLREQLSTIGSSLVVAGTHRKVKVHIHVNDPAEVFRLAAGYGKVSGEKADDMLRQQDAAHHSRRRQVAVVVDSAADLPDEAIEALDVHVVPVRVHFGSHSYLDKVTLTSETFFDLLATSAEPPKTSQPPPGDFRRAFEFLGSHYDGVVYVGLTSRASGTFQCGEAAAARSRTHGQIACVDTGNASLGQGLVALRAAEAAAAGAAIGEVERVARETARRTRTFACLATLEYAVRGGRVPRWARTLADTLHVMPLLATFPDGRISIGGALLGRRNLTAKFARFVRRRLPGGRRWRLAVGHANAAAEAQRLGTLIVEGRDDIELAYEVPIGTALGVHGGPGCLVVAAEEIAPA